MLLLENCRLFNDLKKTVSVLVENQRIAEITDGRLDCENTIDCTGNVLLPGLIDSHVHFRYPGGEHKEDWEHGSRAAVSGGITTVLDMPNNSPPASEKSVLDAKREKASKDSYCNFGFYLGATEENVPEIEAAEKIAGIKLYAGSSTGGLLVENDASIRRVFEAAKKANMLVAVHAEDEQTMKQNTKLAKNRFWQHARYHSKIRSAEAEAIAIERMLEIQKLVGNKLHICHISSKRAMDIVKEAKDAGNWVTAEVCPHHLFLTEHATEEIANFAKVNPSLKTKYDAKALWKFLRNGAIDVIATDHAPHTVEEKKHDYYDAPSGVPGCQTMLPLLLDAVHNELLSIDMLVEACCINPAKIFGIKERGAIKEGNFADLTLVDLDSEQEILNEQQYSKCAWTPFHRWKTKGKVMKTIVNGNLVFDSGKFFEARGREVFNG